MAPRIGLTLGDPNGIGPEIVGKAVRFFENEPDAPELIPIGDWNFPARPGEISARAGALSAAWVCTGVELCLQGKLDALVTAPISKEAWKRAGILHPGHTELLAERCKTRRFGMMLAGKGLRVMLATRHLPLRQVADRLNGEEIRMAVELLLEGLPALGIPEPRIAICGLNPHAGDGGAIGNEEVEWISPLIQRMVSEGLPVSGPWPADTVFHQAAHLHAFDAVVALYHDQGLAPLKLWAFDEGVNITLGLPVIRTSPDHGTAFGIAGRNLAKPDSMIAAIRTAATLARSGLPAVWTQAPSA